MLGMIAKGMGQAMGRRGSALLARAWEIGRPRMGDVVANAIPSAIYGGTMLSQGANPLEALGTAGTDLGMQMGLDSAFGTVGAALSRRLAPQGMAKAALTERMANHANMAKMGSMVSMAIPNPVANSFYDRMRKEQEGQLLAAQTLERSPQPQLAMDETEQQIQVLAAQGGFDPSDPMTRLYLSLP